MEFEKCTALTNNKITPLKENNSQFIIKNSNQHPLKKIQVDGCLIDKAEEKCDWLVVCDTTSRALFIELKGCDVDKAISQLSNTVKLTKEFIKTQLKECYVVCTRYPKSSTTMQLRQLKFYKENNATLSIKSIKAEVEI